MNKKDRIIIMILLRKVSNAMIGIAPNGHIHLNLFKHSLPKALLQLLWGLCSEINNYIVTKGGIVGIL